MKEKTFMEARIYSVWKKTSFILFNSEVVLDKIWETQNLHFLHSITPLSTLIFNIILDFTLYNSKDIIN